MRVRSPSRRVEPRDIRPIEVPNLAADPSDIVLAKLELLRNLVPGARFPALVVAVNREEVGPDGKDACSRFTADTGVPVFPAVTMTEALSHLDATGRLQAADRKRCVEYLAAYGTPEAKAWAAIR